MGCSLGLFVVLVAVAGFGGFGVPGCADLWCWYDIVWAPGA